MFDLLGSILVDFPIAVIKYPDKSNLREKGLGFNRSLRFQTIVQESCSSRA